MTYYPGPRSKSERPKTKNQKLKTQGQALINKTLYFPEQKLLEWMRRAVRPFPLDNHPSFRSSAYRYFQR